MLSSEETRFPLNEEVWRFLHQIARGKVRESLNLAARRRHVSRKRRASARFNFEIMTAWLAADREPNRLHHGGIADIATQDLFEIDSI